MRECENAIQPAVQHPSLADLGLGHRHHFLAHPLPLMVLSKDDNDIFTVVSQALRLIFRDCTLDYDL
jgi:hypothetical protein